MYPVDVFYIIGGTTDPTKIAQTYEVIGVNIRTKEVSQPKDIIHAVLSPATTATSYQLVVCGGFQTNGLVKHCQIYSPKDDR